MTISSQTFGQQTISVVLNEGQMPAKLSTDSNGNTVLVGAEGTVFLTPHMARLSRSTDQVITKGSVKTYASWDAADYDTTAGVWTIGDPTKFVIPAGYSYARITAQFNIADAPVGQNFVTHIEKNTSTTFAGMALQAGVRGTSAGGLSNQATMEWVAVVAGDYFRIYTINVDAVNDHTLSGTGRTWAFIELC